MRGLFSSQLVLIKGAGDIASGVAHRLYRSGFPLVMTELSQPMVVRRKVAFASAVWENTYTLEGVKAVKEEEPSKIYRHHRDGNIPLVVDPKAEMVNYLHPTVIIDAIMAKKNKGTSLKDAPIVIGIGPGFEAGGDAHAVVETKRGHDLGKVILTGCAAPNTGIPGDIEGYSGERVLRSPGEGIFSPLKEIGSPVEKNEIVAYVGSLPLKASMGGVIRGMLYGGIKVKQGMKLGDIDPRAEKANCFTISDKARSVGGGALEALLYLMHYKEDF